MEPVLTEIQQLRAEVKQLTDIVLRLEKSCSRMDDHIDFVDHVYETAQAPVNFVLQKVSRLMGSSQTTQRLLAPPREEKNSHQEHEDTTP
jgi:hypothetical protein